MTFLMTAVGVDLENVGWCRGREVEPVVPGRDVDRARRDHVRRQAAHHGQPVGVAGTQDVRAAGDVRGRADRDVGRALLDVAVEVGLDVVNAQSTAGVADLDRVGPGGGDRDGLEHHGLARGGGRGRGDHGAAWVEDRDDQLLRRIARRAHQGQRPARVERQGQAVDVGRRHQHMVVGAGVDQVAQRRNGRERRREGRGAQRHGEVVAVIADPAGLPTRSWKPLAKKVSV